MNRVVYFSVVDQAVVSGSMFALNLALIGFTTAESYGNFVLVFALSLLAYGAQNAITLMPLNVLLPTRFGQSRRMTLQMLSTLDAAVLIVASIVVAVLGIWTGLPLILCGLGGLLSLTSGAREFHRALFLTNNKPYGLLRLDITAFTTAIVITLVLSNVRPLEDAVLIGLIVGNLTSLAVFRQATHCSLLRLPQMARRYAPYWRKSRWALFGAAVTEARFRLYVFVIEFARGSAALGVIHAGRVLVNPVALLAFAWARASRPILAKQLAATHKRAALETLAVGVVGLTLVGVVYVALLNAVMPYLIAFVPDLGGQEFLKYLPLWSAFAVISVPAICIGVYFQANHRYQVVAISTLASVLLSGLLLGGLFFGAPLKWTIYCLVIGEIVQLLALLYILLPELISARRVQA
ncbi:MAG: hypothetical protein ABJL55_09595 [Roseibium sp.]